MARVHSGGASALAFDAITVEGALIAPAMLARIAKHDAGEQGEADYGIPEGLTLRDEIARYFRIGQALHVELTASKSPSIAATTGFVERLLHDVFGFANIRRGGIRTLGDRQFEVTLEGLGGRVPVMIVPPADDLDRTSAVLTNDGRRRSATSAIQDWLNASSDAAWGLCSNGTILRLVRDNASLTRPAYIEADLRRIFEDEAFADFAALWLLIHASRFGKPGTSTSDCALERWREAAQKAGVAARDRLRDGVEAALLSLGNGFLGHSENGSLRERVRTGELPLPALFGQLLRLAYRLIFLLAAEDRNLLHAPAASAAARKLYAEGYSVGALRDRAVRRTAWDRHHDRWEGLLITFAALAHGEPRLGLPALDGLFAHGTIPDLEKATLSNRGLMEAIYRLAWLKEASALMPVNWRDMETEELGSVYESLLELTPRLNNDGRGFVFAEGSEAHGHARKTSASYYTHDSLVQTLLDSTLNPVLDRVEAEAEDAATALLSVTVLDPACGSGHFLLAAARRIATRLARARSGGVASSADYRRALRDVARACIHGVDRNPMAVELTKVALWIETVEPGKPLGFLDANIRCGDALLGVFDPKVLEAGIPDAAYKLLSGDNEQTAKHFEKRNKAEKEGQGALDYANGGGRLPTAAPIAGEAKALRAMLEDSPAEIAAKRKKFEAARSDPQRWNLRIAADLYIAAFLTPKTGGVPSNSDTVIVPTTAHIWEALSGRNLYQPLIARAQNLAGTARAFHWPLEFPDVIMAGGFDLVLGNPPWDVMQLGEQEYFSQRLPEIAELGGVARKNAIAALEKQNPQAFASYQSDKRWFEAVNEFARASGRFDLTARGKINTYALFAELFTNLVSKRGRAGVVIPTGIAISDTNKHFFESLVSTGRLVSFFNFFEIRQWFPATDDRNPFGLLTIGREQKQAEFAFFLTELSQLSQPKRRYTLTADDIARINPDTKTAPIFRSQADAELAAKIYKNVSRTERPLEWMSLKQNVFTSSSKEDLSEFARAASRDQNRTAIFRGAMIYQYDDRFATYVKDDFRILHGSEKTPEYIAYSDKYVSTEYYLTRTQTKGIRTNYHISIRRIARSTDERMMIAAMLPNVGTDDTASIIVTDQDLSLECALLANLNSIPLDYACGLKIGGTDIRKHNFAQLPIIGPRGYSANELAFIAPRVIELTYTSQSMASFARDVSYHGPPFAWDEDRRAQLRAELDAWYARAYGLTRDELRYVLDPADVKGPDYPSETFRVLKKNEIARFGEYRTARLVLAAYDQLTKHPLAAE